MTAAAKSGQGWGRGLIPAMKLIAERPFAHPEVAARQLALLASGIEAVQDGRIHIEKINYLFLYTLRPVTPGQDPLATAVGTGRPCPACCFAGSPKLAERPRPYPPNDPPSRGRLSFDRGSLQRCSMVRAANSRSSSFKRPRRFSTISMQSECPNDCTPRAASSRSNILARMTWMLTDPPAKDCFARYGSTTNWVRSGERPQRGSSPTAAIPGKSTNWCLNLAGVPTVEHPVLKMDSGKLPYPDLLRIVV